MNIIFLIFIIVCLTGLIFLAGALFGLSGCESLWDWIKEVYREGKETKAEAKAEKAFLHANPLCSTCQKNGKYRKATRMWKRTEQPLPLCDACYKETWNEFYHPEKETKESITPTEVTGARAEL